MTGAQWSELQAQVEVHGPEKLEFENDEGSTLEFEDIAYIAHEDKIVVLLT